MKTAAVVSILLLMAPHAFALGLGDLTDADAGEGIKEALLQGASEAVGTLGRKDGFLKNKKVKIPLPESLKQIDGVMRWFGMGDEAEELVVAMNRAAEAAVPEAKDLLSDALKQMTLQDAKAILTGGRTSGTDYFRKRAEAPLRKKFLPIVKKATGKVALTEKYDAVAGSAAKVGLIDEESSTIHEYVTRKALDGLFLMIAREERAIRKDPAKQANTLLQKVFGALGK
jgi:hypothetical protein